MCDTILYPTQQSLGRQMGPTDSDGQGSGQLSFKRLKTDNYEARTKGKVTRDLERYIYIQRQIFSYADILAHWLESLGSRHKNCRNIPTEVVVHVTLEMVRQIAGSYPFLSGIQFPIELLAAALWVTIKFYSSRNTVPNASFMSQVTCTHFE
eukprot:jgi/Picsp_1/5727/NSC_03086-R1_---NA---